jgi:hypothetical protein
VNCIFGHHGGTESHSDDHGDAAARSHHHDVATAQEHGGKGHDHSATDTCCTRTGKYAVTLTSTPALPDPSVVAVLIAPAGMLKLSVARFVGRVRCAAPLAHAPPLYLRNVTLLI